MHRRSHTILAALLSIAIVVALPVSAIGMVADIKGTVYDADTLNPLQDVRVRAWRASDAWNGNLSSSVGETLTAADGTYVLPSMPDEGIVYAYIDETGNYRDVTAANRGLPPEEAFSWRAIASTATIDAYLQDLQSLVANRTHRLGGANRYQTAIEISANNFFESDWAIIASGASFPDALAAAPLAGVLQAPVLLTPRNHLPTGLIAELARLKVTNIVVIGGTGAVGDAVWNELGSISPSSMNRIAGADRYETAAMVALEVALMNQDDGLQPRATFVCRGDAFPDALAASPFAYTQRIPILLTRSTALPISSAGAWFKLSALNDTAYVVGGTGAVDNIVIQDLADTSATEEVKWLRFAGPDRYATAVDLVTAWSDVYDMISLATGQSFPDALAGGAATGYSYGALLLTPGNSLSGDASSVLQSTGPYVMELQAYGGSGALSDSTLSAANSAMGTDIYDIDDPDNRIRVTGATSVPAGTVFSQGVWPSARIEMRARQRPAGAQAFVDGPDRPLMTVNAAR